MKNLDFDCVVIGAGAAGMAAAAEVAAKNYKVAVVDRESDAGGILLQCIHNGFGLHEFNEQLTGPEYAARFYSQLQKTSAEIFLDTTVLQIQHCEGSHILTCVSSVHGVMLLHARTVVLAMGCRERNRGNIGTAGDRPAGVFTAGLAQRLINIDGYIPGKEVVIVGSGDIGLIMARRLTWSGCHVHAVVELQPYPAGLTRNIVQCLNDFDIPLYLGHIVSAIHGRDRVTCVDVTPLADGKPDYSKTFRIDCDTVLLSVGLVPENELSKESGVEINPVTNGPIVDSYLMTSVDGIFACGNVLHVHDLVDYVTRESRAAGKNVVKYLSGKFDDKQLTVQSGKNIRYVCPNKVNLSGDNLIYMRSLIKSNNNILKVSAVSEDGSSRAIKTLKMAHVQPSEMISLVIKKSELDGIDGNANRIVIDLD